MNSFEIKGNIVDIINEKNFPGRVFVTNGRIESIVRDDSAEGPLIMPGLIDSHVHIESSMLAPSEFAREAVRHGTVATVSDPHEIANVLGRRGLEFMIENGKKVPFKFYFGAPSCVPATGFESSGAEITPDDIEELLSNDDILYLSEMMNFPGVLNEFPDVIKKIEIAKKHGKPVDGHAPGLTGDDAKKYISAGISTDHEAFTLNEAIDKISLGMKILIREGSAAKNFNALHKLIEARPDMVMLCSDDKHPDDLIRGHINLLVKRALDMDYSLFKLLRAAVRNPIEHYGLDTGMLREGDPADMIVVDDLKNFNILKTYISGELVAENGKSLIEPVELTPVNIFNASKKEPRDFAVEAKGSRIKVIKAIDGELITESEERDAKIIGKTVMPDPDNDILKIAVINRYNDSPPAIGFIRGFGIRKGALASSVAHDSHNIIAVGCSDTELCEAVNAVIESSGGLSLHDGLKTFTLPLPIAGLMAAGSAEKVAGLYSELSAMAKNLGCGLKAPYMTLSFMALLVIPSLKLSDKGLFDGNKFEFTELQPD